ncbi:hypothetical protein V5O48_012325 [Marasmius crinis-equi]|uniref:Uncharacterized protein n=1 Tax=Marasmius crinis-equi TaxID=585013 RepID=A0ABR3F3E8_9AGAR
MEKDGTTVDPELLQEIQDAGAERKMMRRVDLGVLPMFAAIYAFSIIDRNNLSSARVAGMGTALSLQTGERYSIVSSIYLVPYVLL